jgi:hypothetical protein
LEVYASREGNRLLLVNKDAKLLSALADGDLYAVLSPVLRALPVLNSSLEIGVRGFTLTTREPDTVPALREEGLVFRLGVAGTRTGEVRPANPAKR